jgi:hypothetical protein
MFLQLCSVRPDVSSFKKMTNPRANAQTKVWGTLTSTKFDNLYGNATSFPIPKTLCLTIGIIKIDDDYELLHLLTKKVDLVWGNNLNKELEPS